MIDFDQFCTELISTTSVEVERAIGFLWFHTVTTEQSSASIATIGGYFREAELHDPNFSRLSGKLKSHKGVSFNGKSNEFRIARDKRVELSEQFSKLAVAEAPADFVKEVDVSRAPLLTQEQFDDAKKMSEMYVVLHCLENSIRALIERVLKKKHGSDWWDKSASSPMKKKHEKRLKDEENDKWLPTRARSGPLYSIDWPDLITLIRKFESDFEPFIGSINFMHRFEDLGKFRNVVAHHGALKEARHYELVMHYYQDWVAQVGSVIE
ncbi:MAG: Swt1 family HEPN domain-containing protein [Rhodobiaceae bacterium]|nr:Swt1 family HEPN domain-containing protein [Rhodobiaceae bacterium]